VRGLRTTLGGVPIAVSEYLPTTRFEQFKFPRSKKSRIRKKWRKDMRNWRRVDCQNDFYLIDKSVFSGSFAMTGHMLVVSPRGYENISKRCAVVRNVGPAA
jgi:hypothetical protein